MLAKQACRHPALAYWLGISLLGPFPVLTSAGLRLEGDPPTQYAELLSLLREVTDTENIQLASGHQQGADLHLTTPLVERVRGDLPWHLIWPRLQGPSLEAVEVYLYFSLIHGLPDVQGQQAPLGGRPLTCLPDLPASGSLGDHPPLLHQLLQDLCTAAWHLLYLTLGVAHKAETLLFLAWPSMAARSDAAVVLEVTTFTGPPGPPGQGLHGRQGRPLFSIL
jgi:hypothetical protein